MPTDIASGKRFFLLKIYHFPVPFAARLSITYTKDRSSGNRETMLHAVQHYSSHTATLSGVAT